MVCLPSVRFRRKTGGILSVLLYYVLIPNSVTFIGDFAFCDCTNLKNIEFSDGTAWLGCNAFDNTLWYNSQSDGAVYAGNALYNYKGTMPENTNIKVKKGTTLIARYAFDGCENLTGINIPNSVIYINSLAFYGCENLTSVFIPNSVKSMGNYMYGVTGNGYSVFMGCSNLKSIILTNSITEIGRDEFRDCTDLTIYGNKNSAAETYANENNIDFFSIDDVPNIDLNKKVLINKQNSIFINGDIDDNVEVNVEILDSESIATIILCDINLTSNGEKYQPEDEVTVYIPCEYPDCNVVWISDDGMVNMNAEYINGYYVFKTNHFSKYAVVRKIDENSENQSSEMSSLDNSTEKSEVSYSSNENSLISNESSNNNGKVDTIVVPNTSDNSTIILFAIFGFLISVVALFFTRRKKSV